MAAKAERQKIPYRDLVALADEDPAIYEATLGKLVTYNIGGDIRVTPDELRELTETYRIDPSFLPPEIEPGRVFSSVARGFRDRQVFGRHTFTIAMEPDPKTDGSIEGVLSRERRIGVRTDGQEFEKVRVGSIAWTPEFPDVLSQPEILDHVIDRAEHDYYTEVFRRIDADFEERRTFLTGSDVSAMVQRILSDSAGIRTRPKGGIWLVPRDAADLLEAVETVVRILDEHFRPVPADGERRPSDTEFNSILVLENRKNSRMVGEVLDHRVTRDLEAAIEELYALGRSGVKPSAAQVARAAERRAEALEVLEHYDRSKVRLEHLDDLLDRYRRIFEQVVRGEAV